MYLRALTENVCELCRDVKGYFLALEKRLGSKPGQFIMLWVPGVGEIPLSVTDEEDKKVLLVIARKGRVTTFIHNNVRPGSVMYLRGPLGRGFQVNSDSRALIVGGGCGAAPLLFLTKMLVRNRSQVTVALGFKDRDSVMLVEEFLKYTKDVYVATEDGSVGVRGTVIDLMEKLVSDGAYDFVYTCGKEAMMKAVVSKAIDMGLEVEASLERLVKCGLGICGSCSLEPLGLRVCADGPVFKGRVLTQLDDFGRWWRDASGRRVPLPA